MAKGDMYIQITHYLNENSNRQNIALTFDEVKKINGGYLPESAYKHQAWWSNSKSHSEAYGWLNAGYKTSEVNLVAQHVIFQRNK